MADEFEKATPRPWKAEVNQSQTLAQIYGEGGTGRWVLNMESEDETGPAKLDENDRANLALLVRAVNAFEPMREALRAVEWAGGVSVDRCPFCNRPRPEGHREECKLAAALRAADGETEGKPT